MSCGAFNVLGLYAAGAIGILLEGMDDNRMIIYKIHKVPELPEFCEVESYSFLVARRVVIVCEMSHINVRLSTTHVTNRLRSCEG